MLWLLGACLAGVGAVLSTVGLLVQKHALSRDARRALKSQHALHSNPRWLGGVTLVLSGKLTVFVALYFAAHSVVVPIEGMALVANMVLSRIFLREPIHWWKALACGAIIAGAVLAALFGARDSQDYSTAELLQLFERRAWIVYMVLSALLFAFVFGVHLWLTPLKRQIQRTETHAKRQTQQARKDAGLPPDKNVDLDGDGVPDAAPELDHDEEEQHEEADHSEADERHAHSHDQRDEEHGLQTHDDQQQQDARCAAAVAHQLRHAATDAPTVDECHASSQSPHKNASHDRDHEVELQSMDKPGQQRSRAHVLAESPAATAASLSLPPPARSPPANVRNHERHASESDEADTAPLSPWRGRRAPLQLGRSTSPRSCGRPFPGSDSDESSSDDDESVPPSSPGTLRRLHSSFDRWSTLHLLCLCGVSSWLDAHALIFAKSLSLVFFSSMRDHDPVRVFGAVWSWACGVLTVALTAAHIYYQARALRFYPASIVVPLVKCMHIVLSSAAGALYFREYVEFDAMQWGILSLAFMLIVSGISGLCMQTASTQNRTLRAKPQQPYQAN